MRWLGFETIPRGDAVLPTCRGAFARACLPKPAPSTSMIGTENTSKKDPTGLRFMSPNTRYVSRTCGVSVCLCVCVSVWLRVCVSVCCVSVCLLVSLETKLKRAPSERQTVPHRPNSHDLIPSRTCGSSSSPSRQINQI